VAIDLRDAEEGNSPVEIKKITNRSADVFHWLLGRRMMKNLNLAVFLFNREVKKASMIRSPSFNSKKYLLSDHSLKFVLLAQIAIDALAEKLIKKLVQVIYMAR